MKVFLWTLIVVLLSGGLLYGVKTMNNEDLVKKGIPVQYGTFAQCLKDRGAVFYGAFWCQHCQDQKKEFGSYEKLLPYVECSTPDEKGQTLICKEKGITGYPTWIFKDGTQVSGKVSWKVLAEKTSCALPDSVASSTSSGL